MDYYLAQIAAECRRGWVTRPKEVRVQDFLLGEQKKKPLTSKEKWAMHLGVELEEN